MNARRDQLGVLRLVARWADRALAEELVHELLLPAVRQMVAEFAPARMKERDALYRRHHKTLIDTSAARATIFERPLRALAEVLEADFGAVVRAPPAQSADFLRSLGRELDIEANGAGRRPSAALAEGLARRPSPRPVG